ncbi:hypothetical protein LCGC14_3030840 [marine sediment metagenome]|uniref:Uncharacterized protein n=1 Tax=marine sediment metagenome TaxID=412755 RepID=A0A0F8Z097_9ZZZZ
MKQSKEKQFQDYKNKWGMSDFRFFVHCYTHNLYGNLNNHLYIVENGISHTLFRIDPHYLVGISMDEIGKKIFEIQSLPTFLKRVKNLETRFFIRSDGSNSELESFEELQEYFLIKKIAGV